MVKLWIFETTITWILYLLYLNLFVMWLKKFFMDKEKLLDLKLYYYIVELEFYIRLAMDFIILF